MTTIAAMTPDDLRAWQKRMGFTYDTAAKALGIGRTTYAEQLRKNEIPQTIFLATVAVEFWPELQELRRADTPIDPKKIPSLKIMRKILKG